MRWHPIGILTLGFLVTLSLGAQSNSNSAAAEGTDSNSKSESADRADSNSKSESADRVDSNSGDAASRCPADMQLIANSYCIDRYEASTAEVTTEDKVVAHSPFLPVEGLRVKAVSEKNVIPQAYINRNQAQAACAESHKRLCTEREWVTACKGPEHTKYPYGNAHKSGYCVDTNRVSPLMKLFEQLGVARYQFAIMNDPDLNQLPGTLAPTGLFTRCTNDYGVYDMVGNVHEWTADPQGTFRGGFYLDTKLNGSGCDYKTVAHPATYHDYSTGFRCCADAE